MINYSFLFHSRLLLIVYVYIRFVNGRPLENQLAEWPTVLKTTEIIIILLNYQANHRTILDTISFT